MGTRVVSPGEKQCPCLQCSLPLPDIIPLTLIRHTRRRVKRKKKKKAKKRKVKRKAATTHRFLMSRKSSITPLPDRLPLFAVLFATHLHTRATTFRRSQSWWPPRAQLSPQYLFDPH